MTRWWKKLVLLLCGVSLATAAAAGAKMSRDEALRLAFADAATVETLSLFLTEKELDRVEVLSGLRPDSALYSLYVGRAQGEVTGYAAIEAVTVRTHPATVLVVLEPQGRLQFVEVLAFFEPEEYLPSRRWLDQFGGKSLGPELRVDGDIHGISGATLSAQSLTRQARKAAVILKVYLERSK